MFLFLKQKYSNKSNLKNNKNNIIKMTSFNIIDLITNNPISKLSDTHNSILLNKVKNTFNQYEQQLFISSFYTYLNFHKVNDFIIDLDNIWQWLGFNRKFNATNCLIKNFILDKDYSKKYLINNNNYFATTAAVAKNKGSGGHNSDKFYLNIKTFKSLCLKAQTKKAYEIHEYYIKLEELIQEVLEEQATEMKNKLLIKENELQYIEEKNKKEYEIKLVKEKALERQKILLKEFENNNSLIYIIKVKTYTNGQYIIKIGESRRGITGRFNEHKSHYEECLLLDCFLVDKSKDFESFLHNHENIRLNRVTDLVNHTNERELFLVGKDLSYQMLLNIINNNIKYFEKNTNNEIEKLKLECEKLLLLNDLNKNENINSFIEEIINNNNKYNQILLNKIDNLEKINTKILEKLNFQELKNMTNFNEPLLTLGPYLQKINPDTLTLVKVYDSVSECMRENHQIKRPSINKAILENTIYHGYRWLYVNRELDPYKIINIQPTKIIKIQNTGYIAKLNKDKNKILNVYLDRKTASLENNYKSPSSLDNAIKNDLLIHNYYYILYNNTSENLKYEFLKKHNIKEILLYKNGVGQYNIENKLIQEYICKYDCIKKLHISDKTLTKALERNILYNNNYFKYIGSKLQI